MANRLKPIGGGKDDAPQIQSAMNACVDPDDRWPNTAGGKITLSPGRYSIQTPLVVPCAGITIEGEGNISTMACALEWKGGDGAMLTLRNPEAKYERCSGFRMANLQLRGERQGTAIAFSDFEKYGTRFAFERIAAHYFNKVFEVNESASYPGELHVYDCHMTWNKQLLDATKKPINEVRFRDCNLHQNGRDPEKYLDPTPQYAIDIRGGSNIVIQDCIIEGQPKTVRIKQAQGVTISGCRFEGNQGGEDPAMEINTCRHIDLTRNFHRILNAEDADEDKVYLYLKNCEDYDLTGTQLRRIMIEHKWVPVR